MKIMITKNGTVERVEPVIIKPSFTNFKGLKSEVIKTTEPITTGNINKLPLNMRKYLNKWKRGK